VALCIVLALMLGGGIWVALAWKGWVAAGVERLSTGVIAQTKLPEDQKASINARLTQLTTDFKDGKISTGQLTGVVEEVSNGPIFPLAAVTAAEMEYVDPSALPDEEKAAGRLSLQRFARGVAEGTISKDEINTIWMMITTPDAAGNRQVKKSLTQEELRSVLAEAKLKADKAAVPEEPFTINYATEFNKAVDRALAKHAGK